MGVGHIVRLDVDGRGVIVDKDTKQPATISVGKDYVRINCHMIYKDALVGLYNRTLDIWNGKNEVVIQP